MGKNWAIAIGINNYDNLKSLKYAQRDAKVMTTWFTRSHARRGNAFHEAPASNCNPNLYF